MKASSSKTSAKELATALRTARQAALLAGGLLQRKYGRFRSLSEKPDAGFVTEADRGAEKLIIREIRRRFPKHSFLAEESGVTDFPGSTHRWIIDPLDGTTNFVHGFPMFCVSIGLEIEGELVLGVIHHPLAGHTYWAVTGQGAYRNGKRIKVSDTKSLKDSMITTGFSYRHAEHLEKELATFTRIVYRSRAIRRTGSAALDLCFVASGQFDGFFEQNLSPWDVAAGLVILKEAGGQYSDFNGKNYHMGTPTLVATNGKIHRLLVQTIRG